MKEGVVSCPKCSGRKTVTGFGCPGFIPVTVKCLHCDGAGEISPEMEARRKDGRSLFELRQTADLSLHEFAQRTGAKPSVVSNVEHGRIDCPPELRRMYRIFAETAEKCR